MPVQDFTKLRVWNEGCHLAEAVYRATEGFPRREWFGLGTQLRNAALSIPSNIAEGCGRASRKELSHFLAIAIGSACELETQVRLAVTLGYVGPEAEQLLARVSRLRRALILLRKRVRARHLPER